MIVEVRKEDFEFKRKGKPARHYMRGKVVSGMPEQGSVRIESLANGKEYIVNIKDVIVIG